MPLLAHLHRGGGSCRFRPLLPPPGSHHLPAATFVDAKVKWVRDRALDHAVEKEKHLRPMHALKNLLFRRPLEGPPAPGTLPLSAIAERRDELRLPFRAIRFIRKYPSVFVEEGASSSDDSRRPHVRATPELVRLHEEEQLIYQSFRGETADRLLRLLMLTPRKRIPLDVVDRLRWDLGLPDDYVRSLLPEYPDYFQIVPSNGDVRGGGGGGTGRLQLELVCWHKDLAVSAMERSSMRTGGYKKGDALAFPLQFSRGFDLEKKVRRWVEEWQRLPYLSPYEDAGRHIDPGSDLGEKWTVGILHELLHLLISKKTERDDLLMLGECVGLRPGFKKVFFHHPGIFYMSNKIRAHTVVLREAYKRDLLVEKHALVGMRYQYIHLMRQSAAMDAETAPSHGTGGRRKRGDGGAGNSLEGSCVDGTNGDDGEGEEDENDMEEEEGEMSGDSQFESEEDDESDDDDDEEEEDEESDNKVGVSHMNDRFSVRSRRNWTEKRAAGAERSARSSSVPLSAVERHLRTRKVSAPFSRKAKKCIDGS